MDRTFTEQHRPAGAGRLRAQAARRVLWASAGMLLAATLAGAAAYGVVFSKSARNEMRTVENFYAGKLREWNEDWQRQAFRQKARLEFLDLAERNDRWARLYSYFVAQGEEQQFSHVMLTTSENRPVFWYGPDGQRLAGALALATPSDWFLDQQTGRLYRVLNQAVWLGPEGMGRLILLRPLDDALLYLNTTSSTGLSLMWRGLTVAQSRHSLATSSALFSRETVTADIPWPGGREPGPVLHIAHVAEAPVSGLEVALAAAVLLCAQALCIWVVLGRWLVMAGQRVSLLDQASRRFAELWAGEIQEPLALDPSVESADDEIADVARSLRGLTEAVASHDAQRQADQEELRHLRNRLAGILDAMPSMLVTVDPDGRITQCNRLALDDAGLDAEAAYGRSVEELFPRLEPELPHLLEALRDGKVWTGHKRPWRKDGENRFEDVTIYPLAETGLEGAVIRLDDVTGRHRMEQMMIQTEKMLSVGGLAAGMAHEINNPLGGILQSIQVIERRVTRELPENRRAAEALGCPIETIQGYLDRREILSMLAGISDSARRAAKIVSGMLEFSRRGEAPFEPADIVSILDKAVALSGSDYDLRKRFDFKKIHIERQIEPELPKAPCSATQIEQVIMNLLRNAAQAMAENPEGRAPVITLRAGRDGDFLHIEVEDNGPGLDSSARARIFEPFYTTKPPGMGTGLGLSVSYFIITENHGGVMAVESEPGQWTRFVIRLPLSPEPPKSA